MKILIGILLALFISSQAYAQSAVEIIDNGKILKEYADGGGVYYHIIYKKKLYYCVINYEYVVSCRVYEEKKTK
jgi:hypothetical protein